MIRSLLGSTARIIYALIAVTGISAAIANYTVTQGAGTDFGSRVNSAIHYAQQLICDMNVASVSGNCAAVAPGNTITAAMTAIAVGGTVTTIPGTGNQPVTQVGSPWPVSLTSTTITGTIAATQSGSWSMTVLNTLTAITPGDAVATSTYTSASPVIGAPLVFNGSTYDRIRSGGQTGIQAVVPTPLTLGGGAALFSGTNATAMVGLTSTQLITAITAQRLYVTRIKCNNSSGTATLVQLRDGSAGNVLDTLAAGATYGGEQGTGSTPLFWTTAGTALYAQNVTTGASVICTASGYSGG